MDNSCHLEVNNFIDEQMKLRQEAKKMEKKPKKQIVTGDKSQDADKITKDSGKKKIEQG